LARGNHAIIEVKPASATRSGIQKDLKTLSLFINRVRYQRALYLIYGDDVSERLLKRITDISGEIEGPAPIELW